MELILGMYLRFRYVANNHINVTTGRNARLTIVEVREGASYLGNRLHTLHRLKIRVPLSPNAIRCPSIYVDNIVKSAEPKHFKILVTAPPPSASGEKDPKIEQSTCRKIARCAVADGSYVNLGVGIPTLVTEYLRHTSVQAG
jgi:3-oxoacid CoA-transferase